MKKFKVTVNGKSYEVDVEELGTAAPAAPVTPAPAPVAAASPAPTPVPAASAASSATQVRVAVGDNVKTGDVLAVIMP